MTEEQIKEQLSRSFVRLVANRAGYKCKIDENDHGTDVTVAEVGSRPKPGGGYRLTETGRYVDLQLKCCCDASTIPMQGGFKFDLEAKTYNDLVARLADLEAAPLVLIVLVLPDDNRSWLSVTSDEMILRRTAYWWRPSHDARPSDNEYSVRIEIPNTNAVDLAFVPQLYAEHYG
jgi:hypothetical protein